MFKNTAVGIWDGFVWLNLLLIQTCSLYGEWGVKAVRDAVQPLVNTPSSLYISLTSTRPPGLPPSASAVHWSVVPNKALGYPFSPPLSSNYHLPRILFPHLFQFLFPWQHSPETDQLRVAMVLMRCYQGRAKVIEELFFQCGRDVIFYYVEVSPLCFWL